MPAGTVDTQIHDHASIPATLRAVFAPAAAPLTARDAWSAPFNGLLTLPEARVDLPDLSAHATALTAAVSTRPTAEALGVAEGAAEGAAEGVAEGEGEAEEAAASQTPAYYQSFTALAEQVQQHLLAVGEPEAVGAQSADTRVERSRQISRTFAAAADRHRGS